MVSEYVIQLFVIFSSQSIGTWGGFPVGRDLMAHSRILAVCHLELEV